MSWASLWKSSRALVRINRARRLLQEGQYLEGYVALEGLDSDEAVVLRWEAREALIQSHLWGWLAELASGCPEEAQAALQRARALGATRHQEEDLRRTWKQTQR